MTPTVRSAAEQASTVVAGTTLGAQFFGITIQDWASILAVVWLLWQLGWSAYGKWQEMRETRKKGG